MNKSVLIGYRWKDRTDRQWLFWLEKKLATLGYQTSLVDLPALSTESNTWLRELTETYQVPSDRIYIVQHDPGCLTILNYLKRMAYTEQPEPALLIAGSPKSKTVLDIVWSDQKLLAGKQEQGMAVSDSDEIMRYVQGLDVKLIVIYGGEILNRIVPSQAKSLKGK